MRACWRSPSTAPLPPVSAPRHSSNHICASCGHRHVLTVRDCGAAYRLRSPVCKEIAPPSSGPPTKHYQEDQP